jgi:hypothetical protein
MLPQQADTLYIHGSATTYAWADIEKQLTIIGEGALPDKNFAWRTTIIQLSNEWPLAK